MIASNGKLAKPTIESVDACARQLYRRARAAGPGFADLATTVRGLQTVIKHLHQESLDPDSLLNQSGQHSDDGRNAVYTRQLTSLVEDSDFTLKQVDTILERYGVAGDAEGRHGGRAGTGRHGTDSQEMARKIELIQNSVASQNLKIDIFLDTIQLYNPVRSHGALENTDDQQLNLIKDKVDAIARKLVRERGSPISDGEEDVWQQFKAELEKEGFSRHVLHEHKEVLRAYIRELESHQLVDNGTTPFVRGLLDQEPPPMTITPASYPTHPDAGFQPNGPPVANEGRRQIPGVTPRQLDPVVPRSLQPYDRSQTPQISNQGTSLSYEPYTSESSDSESNGSQTALISTRDLMALDQYSTDLLAARMGSIHLSPGPWPLPNYSVSPGTSPVNRFLPLAPQPLSIPSSAPQVHDMALSTSPGGQQLGASPRYVPPLQVPSVYSSGLSPTSSVMTPPPPYGSSPTLPPAQTFPALPSSAPATGTDISQHAPMPQQVSRLGPDSKGQEIPLDAKWTKIKRSLVSPVVLEKAGVRYEARPEFVAVLGILTREEVAEFAKKSAEVRNARRPVPEKEKSRESRRHHQGERQDKHRDRELKRRRGSIGDDSDVLWDESDTTEDERGHRKDKRRSREKDENKDGEKGTRIYPAIVSPPSSVNGDQPSPASTVQPKPILKNKNTNHVRFDKDGPREVSPSNSDRPRRDRDRDGDKHRDRDRDRDRSRRDRDRDRDQDRDRDYRDKDRSRRERDRDGDRDRDHRSSSHRHHERDRDRERERDRDKDKDRRSEHEDRLNKKSVLIGGAAATLLSVLTEAAAHL